MSLKAMWIVLGLIAMLMVLVGVHAEEDCSEYKNVSPKCERCCGRKGKFSWGKHTVGDSCDCYTACHHADPETDECDKCCRHNSDQMRADRSSKQRCKCKRKFALFN